MKYAVADSGPGNRPGLRAVQENWPLAPGETFFVDLPEAAELATMRVAADGKSLRPATPQELATREPSLSERLALIEADVTVLKGKP